jgi:hypothetical protein
VGVGQRRDQEISDRAIEPDRALIVDVEPQSLHTSMMSDLVMVSSSRSGFLIRLSRE